MFPIIFLLLVPSALTLLAWRNGLRAIAEAGESSIAIRARALPAMLFLAGPVVMVLGLVGLRAGHIDVTRTNVDTLMLLIGAISSFSALVTSLWAPRGFRPIALFAAAAWVVCFGLVLIGFAALSALR